MKKILLSITAGLLITSTLFAYGTKNYMESGGAKWVVGGTLEVPGTQTVTGTLNVTGATQIGGSTITATASEINVLDISENTETVSTSAISATKRITQIANATGTSTTLAAPGALMVGQIKVIQMTTDGGDVTFALTNIVGQSSGTSATFNDVGDALILLGLPNGKWLVIKEYGVTLS